MLSRGETCFGVLPFFLYAAALQGAPSSNARAMSRIASSLCTCVSPPPASFDPAYHVADATQVAAYRVKMIGRCGALLPLFRLVGVLCIAALWRVESLPRHRGDRPKLNSTAPDYLRSRGVASGVKPNFEARQGSRCRWPDAEAKRLG